MSINTESQEQAIVVTSSKKGRGWELRIVPSPCGASLGFQVWCANAAGFMRPGSVLVPLDTEFAASFHERLGEALHRWGPPPADANGVRQ